MAARSTSSGLPIQARPVGHTERLVRWCRRNPAVAGLLAAIALSLTAGAAVSTHFAIRSARNAGYYEAEYGRAEGLLQEKEGLIGRLDSSLGLQKVATEEAQAQTALAEAELDRAERYLYASQITRAYEAWRRVDVVLAQETLSTCRRDLRGWEYDYLLGLLDSSQQTFLGHVAHVNSVAVSPDGGRIVSGGGWIGKGGELKLWDAETGDDLLDLQGHSGNVWSVAFSPDGRQIASASEDQTIRLWDAETGEDLRVLQGHAQPVLSVAFSPDGHEILSGGNDKTVKVWDAETGELKCTLEGHAKQVMAVAFSPDGRQILSGSDDRTVKLWDRAVWQKPAEN